MSSKPKTGPAPVEQERKVEQAVMDARERERLRQRQAAGYQSTLLTGPAGVQAPANLGVKTLLGS